MSGNIRKSVNIHFDKNEENNKRSKSSTSIKEVIVVVKKKSFTIPIFPTLNYAEN